MKVGLFVLIGIAVIAGLTVYFGRIGEGFKNKYDLTVQLPNTGGLLKNADVQLAGAKIGFVLDKPMISPGNISSVAVKLKIYEDVKIPRDASFKIASAGLLGDVFVEVKLGANFDLSKYNPNDPKQVWQPGEIVTGAPTSGFDELAKKGADTLDDLRVSLADLKTTVAHLNTRLLTDENAKNVKETLEHLNTTTANFAEASKKLDSLVQNAQGAVEAAKHTMTTADAAAGDLRATVVDARKTIGSAKETLDSVKSLVRKASDGEGLLGTLINNRELANNVKSLAVNLREHGLLFYKNSTRPQPPVAKPAPRSR